MGKRLFKDFREFWVASKEKKNAVIENTVKEIRIETPNEFERIFADAMLKNYFVEDADDIDEAAFLVANGDGATRYSISMSAYIGSFLTNPA